VHPRVRSLLAGPGGARLEAIEAAARRRFYLVEPDGENGHVHLDHFEVLKQGKLDTLRPEAPFEEGASLELKLVEVGLYDAAAGVGKVDGWNVVVAGAAKLVGKKVSVTVGRVLDGVAFAALADGAVVPTPITFEAEAEKPTRVASAKKADPEKPATSSRGGQKKVEVEEPAAAEVTADEPEPVEAIEAGESAAEEAPPKKKTRRGTRGGRGRKKTTAATAAADGEAATEAEAEEAAAPQADGRARKPRIHVPPTDRAEQDGPAEETEPVEPVELPDAMPDPEAAVSDGEPPKKKTRRGTRGGRKRRKTPANGQPASGPGEESAAETAGAPAEAVAVVEAPEAEEYVPMSEWIEDFDRRR
jgi:predicted RNA-binding protein with TRAM domain